MLKITIDTASVKNAIAKMEGFSQRRMNAALATAITRTAKEAKEAVQDELKRAIDKPTAYTLNGIKFMGATANRLQARFWYGMEGTGGNIGQGRYLYPQIAGGTRSHKRFERALIARGAMPGNMFAVPGPGAKIDGNGNVSSGQIMQILSQIGTELTAGHSRTLRRRAGESDKQFASRVRVAMGKAGGRYFSIRSQNGGLRPGVYMAKGRDFGGKMGYGESRSIVPVFFFVSHVRYTARFKFYETAERTVRARLNPNIERAIAEQADRLSAKMQGQ